MTARLYGGLRALALAVGVGGALSAAAACRPASEDADLRPPAGFEPPPIRALRPNPAGPDRLGFGAGFYPPDVLDDGRTWHWMASAGDLRFRNDGTDRKLRLLIGVPLRFMSVNPTIQLTLGGRLIDRFTPVTDEVRKEYDVAASSLGDAPVVILHFETSAVARVPGDSRDLGLSVQRFEWSR